MTAISRILPGIVPETLSDIIFKLVLMALAFAAASLLLRDALAVGAHIPLDPNEGWNAYLARAAMGGGPLYPQGLMTNNYPPLSFFIVGALGTIAGDPIVAGRLLSLIAFFAVAGGIIVILREMGADVLASLFGALFFAGALLIASDYVAMDDPQLLGHALQLMGLSLLVQPRRDTDLAALLMAAGLFVKHNLLALPVASALWLFTLSPRAALRFVLGLILLGLTGLALSRFFLGVNLLSAMASPRRWAVANFIAGAKQFGSWAAIAILATVAIAAHRPRDAAARLVGFYAGSALLLGGIFSFGDGVDANIFFDAAIALGLGTGFALLHLPRRWTGPMALAVAAPMALFLAHNHAEANFPYSEAFAREIAPDLGFLEIHPGPALCEDLTLCYWAGKDEPVDVFNLSEAYKTGMRSDAELIRLINSHHFGSAMFSNINDFPFGPDVKSALLAQYRVSRDDDNGVFLEPKAAPTAPP
jgi:hypothetical protein